jgi:hypothetical protein
VAWFRFPFGHSAARASRPEGATEPLDCPLGHDFVVAVLAEARQVLPFASLVMAMLR